MNITNNSTKITITQDGGIGAGAMVAIIFGSIIGLTLIVMAVVYSYIIYQKKKESSEGMIILKNVNIKEDTPSTDSNIEEVSFTHKVSSKAKKLAGKLKKVFKIQKVKPDDEMQFDANQITPGNLNTD